MTVEDARRIKLCGELSAGDWIEAWHNGKLFHRGEVIRTVAATDLFWILDERTGTRRLIDAEALEVLRVPARTATSGPAANFGPASSGQAASCGPVAAVGVSGRPAGEAPAARVPASHVPLFQAPSLVT